MHAGGSVQWQDKEDEAEQVRVLCNALFRFFCFESLSYPPLFRRYERCSTCGGGGCKDGKAKAKCSGCNGQGVKIIRLAQLAAAKLCCNCFWAANCVGGIAFGELCCVFDQDDQEADRAGHGAADAGATRDVRRVTCSSIPCSCVPCSVFRLPCDSCRATICPHLTRPDAPTAAAKA